MRGVYSRPQIHDWEGGVREGSEEVKTKTKKCENKEWKV